MYLRKRTIPSRIRSLVFELLELVARPKGAFVFSKGCGVTSTRIAGCGAGAGADMRAQAQRSLASQDRTHLPPAHLRGTAFVGLKNYRRQIEDSQFWIAATVTIFHAAVTTAANKTGPTRWSRAWSRRCG